MAAGKGEAGPRRIACLAVTDGGQRLASRLAAALPDATLIPTRSEFAGEVAKLWPAYDGFIFVMAAGAVVRLIAPLVDDKERDPAVVVVDEQGRYSVSLLSGHLGGGNALAREVARILGGQAVITTASDVLGHIALDLWARELGLVVEERSAMTRASAMLVNHGVLRIFSEIPVASLPRDFVAVAEPDAADCIISHRLAAWPAAALVLRPRHLVVGIGCNRGTTSGQIATALDEAFANNGLSQRAIRNLASIDVKADEAGLLAFAGERGFSIEFYTKDELNRVAGISPSEAVLRATGAQGVAEPAALLSGNADNLLVRKMKWKDVTIAIAQAPSTLSAPAPAA